MDTERLKINVKVTSSYLDNYRIKKISEKIRESIYNTVNEIDRDSYPLVVEIEIKTST